MNDKLEFEVVYICTRCLEECNLVELKVGHTPCCQAEYIQWGLNIRATFLEWLEIFLEISDLSPNDLQFVRQHVRAMHPDAKKRRKTYAKVENPWPGRLSQATTKRGMKTDLGKRAPSSKPRAKSLDIISSPENNSWAVDIIINGKNDHRVYGTDRADARRKARSWLRGRNMTITAAHQILEEPGKTEIIFN